MHANPRLLLHRNAQRISAVTLLLQRQTEREHKWRRRQAGRQACRQGGREGGRPAGRRKPMPALPACLLRQKGERMRVKVGYWTATIKRGTPLHTHTHTQIYVYIYILSLIMPSILSVRTLTEQQQQRTTTTTTSLKLSQVCAPPPPSPHCLSFSSSSSPSSFFFLSPHERCCCPCSCSLFVFRRLRSLAFQGRYSPVWKPSRLLVCGGSVGGGVLCVCEWYRPGIPSVETFKVFGCCCGCVIPPGI